MLLMGKELRVIHVTTHVALRRVPDLVTRDRVGRVIRLAQRDDDVPRRGAAEDRRVRAQSARRRGRALRRRGEEGDRPRRRSGARATASTSTVPCPPIRSSRARGAASSTSSSPCTTTRGTCPVKTLGFNYDEATGTWTGLSGVNVTVGLPFLRVSVDHGTAFDRAWKGIANPESMVEALEVAVRMLSAHRAG